MKNSSAFLAVSLKYPDDADAPLISAKESGLLAKRMVEIARENNIPVVENDIAANVLSMRQIGECIPESTWEAIAKVFAFIKKMEGS
ncbi:EscU/YscU/HrcU family type III secretion system export apparatus switch protein [Treponema sp.]|uniref:EscU/YscU/HrcU family type III secretion system export apparatus switch protein n=1 Tax=Treponema sp. TaxID=166 RepID=UPI003F0AEADE